MYDDYFIFDNVVHMFDNRESNLLPGGDQVVRNIEGHHSGGYHNGEATLPPNFATRRTDIDEALAYLFETSSTDMAMAQAVPLFGYWKDGFAPAKLQYELKQAAPDRVVFCGGTDPVYFGVRGATDEIRRQVDEWGAVSLKFYKGHPDGHSWRADDRAIAYPLYETALEMGLTNVQFHCGIPFGQEYVDDLRPNDIQGAARDFPDLQFVIHHLGQPYIDETISIAARFPNVWLALSSVVINQWALAPYEVYHKLGKVMRTIGSDRLLWGTEAFIWPNIQSMIRSFADIQIPEELQDQYGYPEITREDKAAIFGENQARLLGVDVSALRDKGAQEALAA